MINSLRGMKDLIPQESNKYLEIIRICTDIATNFGYNYINTPLLEETGLFNRSVGDSSDIVGKEMYNFNDKSGQDICLRPEGTAGIVRSFIQQKKDRILGEKEKYFYYGPMFRYEKPQLGRFRQFTQFGVESFGEGNVKEDANIIFMVSSILKALEISYTLEINSLGCRNCMPIYKTKLSSFFSNIQELCSDCERRKVLNPLRVLDCKSPICQESIKDIPLITDCLCKECSQSFEQLKYLLQLLKIDFKVNKKLVRGLDYYSKTCFEFVSNEIGAQNSLAGGGRYDYLIESLGGKPTSGIGFALGIERLMDLVTFKENEPEGYYLGALCKEAEEKVFSLSSEFKMFSKTFECYDSRPIRYFLKQANKLNCRYLILIGEEELSSKKFKVKDLVSGEENFFYFK